MEVASSIQAEHAVRRTGLIIFGVLQIILGLLSAAVVLIVAASEELAKRAEQAPSGAALASALVVYGIGAAYFITVGIGSLRGRRWARSLSVVVSALWGVAGIVGGLMTAVVLPRTLAAAGSTQTTMIGGCAALVILVAGIALPLVIHLFYRREDVRVTFELLDPKPRWTDRVPLPVLAVVLVLGFGAIALTANLGNPRLMLFGREIAGTPAAMMLFAFAGLSAVLAVQLYRLKESAWWTLILLQIAGIAVGISIVATTEPSGAAPGTVAEIADVYRDPWFIAVFAATWIGYFAFLLYLRRFFVLSPAPLTRRDD
ncbi:MAG TPA: hypothetical protein VM779_11540 [Thermoanaerobaculia bacterium]|nr:hypothetical protein [Thermoanaerobaculia bacterium]